MPSVFLNSPADAHAATIPQPNDGKDGEVGESALQTDLQTSITQMVTDAILHADGTLSTARAEAEAYYKGEKPAPADEGRSEVVMTVLRDVVLQMMPSLLRILFGEEAAVEYAPSNKEQIEMAEQVTRFVLDVILQQDNPGF